ncbi:MAG: hypothetical protein ACJASQ_002716 [Crocinitomicaceae bacterium]|jgi:hypothetical protein
MDELRNFLLNHEVRMGEDFQRSHPVYYDALDSALLHYFSTFRTRKTTAHLSLDIENNSREALAFNYTDVFNTRDCINSCHNFFELLIKSLLLNVRTANEARRLNFAGKLNCLSENIENEIIKDYTFLIDDPFLVVLNELNRLRNDMTHDVSKSINIHGLDFLMSQRLIPIILKVIKADITLGTIPKYPINLVTHSGINILEFISSIDYGIEEYSKPKSSGHLFMQLGALAHIKEIGRVCIQNTLKVTDDHSYSWYDNDYEKPHLRDQAFVELERKNKCFHSIHKCYCCGVKSLVVYKKVFNDFFTEKDTFVSWANCYSCNYNIKNNLGDPCIFGLIPFELFPESVED